MIYNPTKSFLFLFFFVTALNCSSQVSNSLEIFSGESKKFTLFVNGKKMNENAVANVKVENLENLKCYVRIVFEDKKIPDLEKKKLELNYPGKEAQKSMINVYSIKEKNGKYKLVFVSRTEK